VVGWVLHLGGKRWRENLGEGGGEGKVGRVQCGKLGCDESVGEDTKRAVVQETDPGLQVGWRGAIRSRRYEGRNSWDEAPTMRYGAHEGRVLLFIIDRNGDRTQQRTLRQCDKWSDGSSDGRADGYTGCTVCTDRASDGKRLCFPTARGIGRKKSVTVSDGWPPQGMERRHEGKQHGGGSAVFWWGRKILSLGKGGVGRGGK